MIEILAFLSALPEFIGLVKAFRVWLARISGNDPKVFLSNLTQTLTALSTAETPEQRKDAAKQIAELIAKLP